MGQLNRVFQGISVAFILLNLTSCSAQLCRDPLGCIAVEADASLEIGVQMPSSSLDQWTGIEILNGIERALQEKVNVKGHPVVIRKEGTSCLSAELPVSSSQFSQNESMVGVIGPACSGNTEVFLSMLDQAGKVVLPVVPIDMQRAFNGAFLFSPTIKDQSVKVAEIIFKSFPSVPAVIMVEESLSSWSSKIQQSFNDLGIDIRHAVISGSIASDLGEILPSLDTPVTILLVISDHNTYQSIRNIEIHEFFNKVIFTPYQTVQVNTFSGWNGWYWLSPPHPVTIDDRSTLYATSYDAAQFLLKSIDMVALPQPGGRLLIPRQLLRQQLRTSIFHGVQGTYNCSTGPTCLYAEEMIFSQLK